MTENITAMTIGSLDPTGQRGILADLQTFSEHKINGVCALTQSTAQNRTEFRAFSKVSSSYLHDQISLIFEDFHPSAIKTGLIGTRDNIRHVASELKYLDAKNLVVDPILVNSKNIPLFDRTQASDYRNYLIPMATVVTPNVHEAELLTSRKIDNLTELENAGRELLALGAKSVLITGFDYGNDFVDLYLNSSIERQFFNKKISLNRKGIGDIYSAEITARLAKGKEPMEAVWKSWLYTKENFLIPVRQPVFIK